MMDVTQVLITALGALLVLFVALLCAVIGKYLVGSRSSAPKRGELVYMLRVDDKGRMKIKRHKGNVSTVRQWGIDDNEL